MSQPPPSGPFDFEALRKLLQQLGLDATNLDLNEMFTHIQRLQHSPGAMFAMTNADLDPDAAWRTTLTAAKALVADSGADPTLTSQEQLAVVDAERLAQSWLTPVTKFSPTGRPARAIRRQDWLDATGDGWRGVIEPIIDGITEALERGTMADAPEEALPMQHMLAPMMRHSASLMYRDRLKRELAAIAADILSGTELGFNLLGNSEVVLIASNVANFTRDLDADPRDMTLYLLLREAARQRLFHHVGWLEPQMTALLRHFSREITIDFDSIAGQFSPEKLEGLSLEDVVKVGEEVRGSFFKPATTDAQTAILQRLEVLLALVEGWVDHVTNQATTRWMPNATQFDEVLQRRRAAAGPVTAVFTELLGLDLRPRLLRDARNLWAAVEHHRGMEARDDVWRHPDVLPTSAHLSDPIAFALGESPRSAPEDELDIELRKLLGEAES